MVESIEVVILDSQRDGIIQITDSLERYDSLDAIHIVSHGDVAELSLGNAKLDRSNLDNYADSLLNWSRSLTEDADILLYGCNVAGGLTGVEFVSDFSDYTQADISASTDLTGSKNLGGDWDLEYVSGAIEEDLAFGDLVEQNYEYVLDSLTDNNIPIFKNGTYFKELPADVTLPGSDGGSTFPSSPSRVQLNLNKFFDAPDINLDPPDLLDPGMIDMIENSNFRIEYFPIDLSYVDSPSNPGTSIVNFGEAENQPFSLYFGNGNFSIIENNPNYDYDKPKINSLIFPFDASSLNFNPTNFEFTSVYLNRIGPIDPDNNSITFQFDKGSFDFSSLTSKNVLAFEFESGIYDFYDIEADNTVSFGNNLTFEATGVSFRSDSVTFDYKPGTFNFNSASFAKNANLYEYKLSSANFNAGVNVEKFNASDYRALDYAFKNDELFDSKYYLDKYVVPDGTNPFTSYNEGGYQSGRNPNGLFDVNYYLLNNADVLNSGEEPLRQYATRGYKQDNLNRDPNALFDTSYYKAQNSDIVAADANPLLHYIQSGYQENFDSRDPNALFDTSYYSAKNPDVVAAGANPLQHYLEFGWQESRRDNPGGFNPNRDPSQFFDTSHYFDTHSDVRIASYEMPSANALQHYLEFGNDGRFANEDRVTHSLFETEYVTSFSTFVDSNSEGFRFVQNEINTNNNGIQIFPRNDGRIRVVQASSIDEITDPFERIIEGIVYSIYAAGAFLVTELGEFVWEVAEGSNTLSHYSFSLGDVNPTGNIFVSPGDSEGSISTYVFPKNPNVESILDLNGNENIFYTPLEPTEEISSSNVFPQRDEILEGLLNEPFIFPDASVVPQGLYIIDNSTGNPYPVGSSSSQGIQEVEDFVSGLSTLRTPTANKSGLFEIEQTGILNYRVPTGRTKSDGTLETIDLDGFRGKVILEAKFLRDPARSLRIPTSQAPQFLKDRQVAQDRREFERIETIIKNPNIPFTELEVIVSDSRLVPYFETLLNEFDISVKVIVTPTQIK